MMDAFAVADAINANAVMNNFASFIYISLYELSGDLSPFISRVIRKHKSSQKLTN
ncbi:hypothetical protein KUC3_22670 [Alteromonas sp. KC3]|nr:hypothetical protein KUC3_22670 [Alteromonas sp. KC3]BCO23372.1 hypothetical protein KUC14_22410 [Alteromonas sp. KC14]